MGAEISVDRDYISWWTPLRFLAPHSCLPAGNYNLKIIFTIGILKLNLAV